MEYFKSVTILTSVGIWCFEREKVITLMIYGSEEISQKRRKHGCLFIHFTFFYNSLDDVTTFCIHGTKTLL